MRVQGVLADLGRGIRADAERCDRLQPLLVEQQTLLARTDGNGLARINPVISELVSELEASASERSGLMKLLGLAADSDGFSALIDKLPAPLSEQLRNLWGGLEDRLVRCQALNERNGELLASHRDALDQLMGTAVNPYDGLR